MDGFDGVSPGCFCNVIVRNEHSANSDGMLLSVNVNSLIENERERIIIKNLASVPQSLRFGYSVRRETLI
jgi:hypothetical protein